MKLRKPSAWKIYQEALVPAEKIYGEAVARAWTVYQEARALAWKAYVEVQAPARKTYEETEEFARIRRPRKSMASRARSSISRWRVNVWPGSRWRRSCPTSIWM